jgi:hypothetical protein
MEKAPENSKNNNEVPSLDGINVEEYGLEDFEHVILGTDPVALETSKGELEERILELRSRLDEFDGQVLQGERAKEVERVALELHKTSRKLEMLRLQEELQSMAA